MRKVGLRAVMVLVFAVAAAAWSPVESEAAIRRFSATTKNCYYDGNLYSWGACRGPQRCARGRDDEYYWEDDATCETPVQTQGGKPQV